MFLNSFATAWYDQIGMKWEIKRERREEKLVERETELGKKNMRHAVSVSLEKVPLH